jgi:hypothetical protein
MRGIVRTPVSGDDEILATAEYGRICALAGKVQRDLQERAVVHRDLFAANPFDPALFSTVSLAMAFSAPWCTAGQLRVANRAVLWGFAADWQIDYLAKSSAEVDAIVTGCLSVADGAAPSADNPLGRFLAELRDELATVPAFEALRPIWRDELARMLAGMAREWDWRAARAADPGGQAGPTFDEYLSNADNLGASFVNVSHWVFTGGPEALDHLTALTVASAEAQRVLRLVNDLATYERDLEWGDLNALMLVADRAELTRQIAVLVDRCRELLRPLESSCPPETSYLTRQLGFATGFYRTADFWGSL